jgi:hypothetical protein
VEYDEVVEVFQDGFVEGIWMHKPSSRYEAPHLEGHDDTEGFSWYVL